MCDCVCQICFGCTVTVCCSVCVVSSLVCLGRLPIGEREGTVPTAVDGLVVALRIPADVGKQLAGSVRLVHEQY